MSATLEPKSKVAPIACCPTCHARSNRLIPLICTLAFNGAEFYCLRCGRRFGWLDPLGRKATLVLDERHEALRAEWDEHAGKKLLTGGALHTNCDTCMTTREQHLRHATDAEKAAHEGAVAWLKDRVEVRW